MNTETVTETRL